MLYDKYFRIVVICLIVLFPVLVNLITHWGSITMVLLTLLGLPLVFSSKNRSNVSKEEKWVMWAFAAYFLVYVFSFFINGMLGRLGDPRLKYLDHEVRFLFIIPIFLLLVRARIPQVFFWISIWVGASISGIFAILSKVWQIGERVSGSYHSIAFGDLSLAFAFTSLVSFGFFCGKKRVFNFIPLIAFGLGMGAVVFSQTRGALIAIPVLFVIFYFYVGKFLPRPYRIWLVVCIVIIMVAAYLTPATKIAHRFELVFSEVTTYLREDKVSLSSSAHRIEGWRAAIDMFAQHPAIGVGPGSFRSHVQDMIRDGERSKIIRKFSHPHNAYLAVMADCGILGLAALLAIFGLPLWWAVVGLRSKKITWDLGFAGIIFVFSFMQFGMTETIFGRNVNISAYTVFMATIMAVAKHQYAYEQNDVNSHGSEK